MKVKATPWCESVTFTVFTNAPCKYVYTVKSVKAAPGAGKPLASVGANANVPLLDVTIRSNPQTVCGSIRTIVIGNL
jgi:hypothetical protein